MRRIAILSVACGSFLAAPSIAQGHSNEPRTAVIFDDVGACALTVARSEDPTLAMTYSIAMEDLPNPDHDLPDAKTHQFIAVCRSWSTREPPPRYLAVDDLQRSINIGYEEPAALEEAGDASADVQAQVDETVKKVLSEAFDQMREIFVASGSFSGDHILAAIKGVIRGVLQSTAPQLNTPTPRAE